MALAWSMTNVYDIGPGDTWWAASDVGWVVGHSYIVYAPLIVGATSIVYEGKPVGTPDAASFWRVIAAHGVKGLFTAPTAIRAAMARLALRMTSRKVRTRMSPAACTKPGMKPSMHPSMLAAMIWNGVALPRMILPIRRVIMAGA